jgi:hypothetical protein
VRRGKEPRAVKLTVTGAKFLALELGVNCDYRFLYTAGGEPAE